jgi:beta-1,2-mannobiose phosphorylase / 1,2-beta-oligomannan phosphorylase
MPKALKKPKKVVKKQTKKIRKVVKSSKKLTAKKIIKTTKLIRSPRNPIIEPRQNYWESQAVFNPAVISSGGRIHLFYRALGADGISRIGYASSKDGINFDERLSYPVYFVENAEEMKKHWPYTSPARYDTAIYASGGGWGGCEDPRTVLIDGYVYMTFNMFNGWDSMRVAVTSIKEKDLLNKKWFWENFSYLSHSGDRQKNWVLFPEKINGKFAIFHNLDKGNPSRVGVVFVNKLDTSETPKGKDAPDPQSLPDHIVAWHKRTRSAAAPPIKTEDGWLLLYHAMDKDDGNRYKLGALLLDLKDPEKVIYRAQYPILEPDKWYENDWKPGIIYASGAIVRNGKLFVYYGGGDKHIGIASIKLSDLINSMKKNGAVKLEKNKSLEVE